MILKYYFEAQRVLIYSFATWNDVIAFDSVLTPNVRHQPRAKPVGCMPLLCGYSSTAHEGSALPIS